MSIQNSLDFVIQWHITERCNLACTHCYQEGSRRNELSLAEIKRGLDEIKDLFQGWEEAYGVSCAPSFNVTGGEPFLRDDFFEILSEMRRRGFESSVLTNGTLVDREKAILLADFDVKGVQVSIEGPEEVHDAIRGPGSHARALAGVEHLLDANLVVTLNITLSKLNAESMHTLLRTASHLGVQRVGFSRLVPSGRGRGLISEMLPSGAVKDLYRSLLSRDIRNLEIVTGDPVASQFREDLQAKKKKHRPRASIAAPCGGCSAGVSGLTLLPDGTVLPCRRLPLPVGNIRSDSLREVWALSPVLEALRDKTRYHGRCGSCERWDSCRGCRAIAYAAAQGRSEQAYLAEDPQCFLA